MEIWRQDKITFIQQIISLSEVQEFFRLLAFKNTFHFHFWVKCYCSTATHTECLCFPLTLHPFKPRERKSGVWDRWLGPTRGQLIRVFPVHQLQAGEKETLVSWWVRSPGWPSRTNRHIQLVSAVGCISIEDHRVDHATCCCIKQKIWLYISMWKKSYLARQPVKDAVFCLLSLQLIQLLDIKMWC